MVDVIIQNGGVDEGSLLGLLEELSFSPPSVTSASRSRSVCSSINSSINEVQHLDDKSSSVNSSNKQHITLDKNIGERDIGATCDKKDCNTTTTTKEDREDENQLLQGEEEQELPQLSQDKSETSQPENATQSQQRQHQREEEGSKKGSVNDVVLQLERMYPTVFNFINGGGKYKKQPKVPEMILLCDSYSSCCCSSSSNASVTGGKEVSRRKEKQERNNTAGDDDNDNDDTESRVSKLTLPKDLCSMSSLSTRTTRPRRSKRGRKLRRRKKRKDGDGTTATSKSNHHKKQEDSKRRKRRLRVRNTSATSSASSSNDEESIIVTFQHKQEHSPLPSPVSGNEHRASSMPIVLTIGGRSYEGTYSGDLEVKTTVDGKVTNKDSGNEDDDSPLLPNGIGIIRFVNTDMYMGEMLEGEMNGEGTYMFGTNDSDPPSIRQRVVMRGEFMNNLFWL